jgi:bla regulator protein BlaR1
MIPESLSPLANHLWQSTLFAAVAGLLTLALRKNPARARFWVWMAASCKFLIPISVLITLGSQVQWRPLPVVTQSNFAAAVEQVSQPFTGPMVSAPLPATFPSAPNRLQTVLFGIWACGFLAISCSWLVRLRRIMKAVRAASSVQIDVPIRTISSQGLLEPGVFGVFRPVLLLPEGIFERLTPTQLNAVIAHELCHVRHRDNLIAVIQMFVETVFWFHPLVWWIGKRMVEERERACDEEVISMTGEPKAYAEGILNICKLYVESPLTCVSGVTGGANLKKRIEVIMNNRSTLKLNFAKKAGLAAAGVLAIAIPVILGVTNAPPLRAQAESNLRFEVASVRRVEIPTTVNGGVPVFPPTGGIGTSDPIRITYRGTWLGPLIADAFGVRGDQISGLGSVSKERYDIVANIPQGATKEQFNVMLGNLLRDRFHLRFHLESKILPVYALRVTKNGPKFKETARRADDATVPSGGIGAPDAQGCPTLPPNYQGMVGRPSPGEVCWAAQDVPIAKLAGLIEQPAGRPIVDETGLAGHYDFKIHYEVMVRRTADAGVAPDPAPIIFTAVQEQLGLKLESSTSSFPQLVIDSIDRDPTDN